MKYLKLGVEYDNKMIECKINIFKAYFEGSHHSCKCPQFNSIQFNSKGLIKDEKKWMIQFKKKKKNIFVIVLFKHFRRKSWIDLYITFFYGEKKS